MLRLSKTTNENLNTLKQQKEDLEIKIAEHQVKRIKPLDENIVYKWPMSFADVDITDTLASKRMIDLFVNKVILYDDYFDIVFNASEDNAQNIKLENIKDYTNLENQLNNKKEQSEHSGSDCFSMVQSRGLEPPWISPHASETCVSAIPPQLQKQTLDLYILHPKCLIRKKIYQ